jgi:hypothetical protein
MMRLDWVDHIAQRNGARVVLPGQAVDGQGTIYDSISLDDVMELVHQRDRCEAVIGELLGDDNPESWSGGFIYWLEAVEDHLGIKPHKPAWQERDEATAADPLHTHTPEPNA